MKKKQKILKSKNLMKMNGEWIAQQNIPAEEFFGLLTDIFEQAMVNIGFICENKEKNENE